MQTFAKTKISLAVGTGLMVMAGASHAVSGAPVARTLKPALAAPALQANADALYGATGFTGTLPVAMNFTAPADTLSAGGFALLSAGADGLIVNGATPGGAPSSTPGATDDIAIYAGPAGASQVNLTVTVPGAGADFTENVSTATNASANFSVTTAGNASLRVNPTTGALEFTADKTASPIAWATVNLEVKVPAGLNSIRAEDGSGPTPIAAVAAQSVFNTVAPTVVARTRKTALAALIDGVEIDTVTPLAAAIVVGAANAGVTFTSNVAGCSPSATDVNNAADIAAAAAAAPATGLTSTLTGSVNSLTFAGLTTDWTTGGALVDAAAYGSNCFNTGVSTAVGLPFNLAITGNLANQPTYSLVFKADGTNQVLSALPAIVDGAAPTVTKAEIGAAVGTTSPLSLFFSEPMTISGGAGGALGALREVGENVFFGSNSIAALNLNDGTDLSLTGPGVIAGLGAITPNADGVSVLTINGLLTTRVTGATVNVTSGLGLQESNDTGFNSAVPALDLAGPFSGAVLSTSGSTEGTIATGIATTTPPVTIAFGDTTAFAATTVADVNKIGLITVNFPAGKGVGFAAGKTFASLTGQIVVTVTGNSVAGDPVTFQFFPTAIASGVPAAGQMVLSTSTNGAANTLIINPPTDLIYSKITAPIAGQMTVDYLNLDNGQPVDVLVGTIAQAPVVAAGQEIVNLPLSAVATTNTLVTQSITGQLTGASSGSLVKAFLAQWLDNPTGSTLTANITSGRISNGTDRVATDLAIEFVDEAALEALIAAQRNAVKPAVAAVPGVSDAVKAGTASPIPVYVKLVRSSDVQGNTKGAQNYLEARAFLATTVAGARAAVPAGAGGDDPVYEVTLDPQTGNITGRLTGNVRISQGSTGGTPRGFSLISPAPNAEGLVDGNGRFNLLVGIDPDTAEIAAGSRGVSNMFLILVHEDQTNARRFTQLTSASPGAANYVPFDPNLYNLRGTRTVLGVNGIAAPTANGAAGQPILLSNYLVLDTEPAGAWALFGLKNPAFTSANTTGNNFVRHFVGTDSTTGVPQSFWVSDGVGGDMALALNGNRLSLLTETGNNGTTLSTFGSSSFLTGAVALAWNNDATTANGRVTFAQAALPSTVRIPRNWSLVTVPTAGLNSNSLDAIMRVGQQAASQFTWIKSADQATTPFNSLGLVPGEAVFVFSAAGTGNL